MLSLSPNRGRPKSMHTNTFDPWVEANRLGIEIIREPLEGARGYTDGSHRVWVHDGLSLCEERVTLVHELIHVSFGHCGEQPPDVEAMVRLLTARWLVPWSCLLGAWGETVDVRAVAEMLCVTTDVVLDRIGYATSQELAMLEGALCDSLAA